MRRVNKCFDLVALARGDSSLHIAVAEHDVEKVRRLLETGSPVDQQGNFDSTPLHIASWLGDVEIVQMLLKHGANANEQRTDGRTPLDLAELRLRGVGDMVPEGLSIDRVAGNSRDVAALLREATEGQDLVLQFDLESTSSGDVMFICTSCIGGVKKASIYVDPERHNLHSLQETLARDLNISQARLRLIKRGESRLPCETDNWMTLAELFDVSERTTQADSKHDEKCNTALNDLSLSSVSTCATNLDRICYD